MGMGIPGLGVTGAGSGRESGRGGSSLSRSSAVAREIWEGSLEVLSLSSEAPSSDPIGWVGTSSNATESISSWNPGSSASDVLNSIVPSSSGVSPFTAIRFVAPVASISPVSLEGNREGVPVAISSAICSVDRTGFLWRVQSSGVRFVF